MLLRIAVQNLSHGGHRINDSEGDRWSALTERFTAAAPDIVIVNEATNWDTLNPDSEGTEHRWPVAETHAVKLGLAVAGVAPSRSGNAVAILYRPETLGKPRTWDDKHSQLFYHGSGVAAWDIPGWTKPLAVGGVHINPFAREFALPEVSTLACRIYRWSPFGVVGGDFNFPPLYGRDPDRSRMQPHNRMLRLEDPLDPDSPPWRGVGQRLREGGFHDVAAELHQRRLADGRDDQDLLAYTGITERVDWLAVSGPLLDAVVDYEKLDAPVGASDHDGCLAVLDTTLADTSAVFNYA